MAVNGRSSLRYFCAILGAAPDIEPCVGICVWRVSIDPPGLFWTRLDESFPTGARCMSTGHVYECPWHMSIRLPMRMSKRTYARCRTLCTGDGCRWKVVWVHFMSFQVIFRLYLFVVLPMAIDGRLFFFQLQGILDFYGPMSVHMFGCIWVHA